MSPFRKIACCDRPIRLGMFVFQPLTQHRLGWFIPEFTQRNSTRGARRSSRLLMTALPRCRPSLNPL